MKINPMKINSKSHISKIFLVCMVLFTSSLKAQMNTLGLFGGMTNVGDPKLKGSVSYNPVLQQYLLSGSGVNTWFTQDQFNYLWKKLKGDFIVTAQIAFIGKGKEAHRKIGWMVRNSLDSNAAHINISIHGDGLT